MEFFGREVEINELVRIRELSRTHARFTVVTGRRRVGKTELLEHALNDGKMRYLYLLITNRAERELCGILQDEVQRVLEAPILGRAERFSQLFEAILLSAQKEPLTLVIDEFQEFDKIDPAIFGEMQGVWDRLHKKCRINFVVCGSVNRLMHKIFFDDSQPLYGRNTGSIRIDPFPTSVIKDIFAAHCPGYAKSDLLALWTLTGGIARYVEHFMDNGAFTRKDMLRLVYSLSSSYATEGETILGAEFGPDHGVYFSIMSAIASGRTSYAEILNQIGFDIGGQLTRLERSYELVSKIQPFAEPSATKNCRYRIDDCFFRFWFRFVYRYQHLIAQKMFDELVAQAERDFDAFAGLSLERYFRAKFLEESRYTKIGGWWDRKGENEIDLVCENEFKGTLDFFEVKRDAKRYDRKSLAAKVEAFLCKNPEKRNLKMTLGALSLADM